jgi:hypothetical protein
VIEVVSLNSYSQWIIFDDEATEVVSELNIQVLFLFFLLLCCVKMCCLPNMADVLWLQCIPPHRKRQLRLSSILFHTKQ